MILEVSWNLAISKTPSALWFLMVKLLEWVACFHWRCYLQILDCSNNLKNSLGHGPQFLMISFEAHVDLYLAILIMAVFWNTSPCEDFLWHLVFLLRVCFFLGVGSFTHTFTLENLSKPLAYILSIWLGRRCCKELTLGHVTKWYICDLCTIMNFCNHSTK